MVTHTPRPAFAAVSGAEKPRIVVVGEAWGESEDQVHRPFAGESGKEFFRMLGEAMPEIAPELHRRVCDQHRYGLAWVRDREDWFREAGIALTNVLAFRPPGNKLEDLCCSKKELELASDYEALRYPALAKGKYLRGEFLSELPRLYEELASWSPNLILALGNTATWATLQATNIGSIRGAVVASVVPELAGRKVLPSYHPAAVLRQWNWRPIVVADLMKAAREADFPEIRRPRRRLLVWPTIEEIEAWVRETLASPPPYLSPDVETAFGQITCIGFSRSPTREWTVAARPQWATEGIVIPLVDQRNPGWSHWHDPRMERRAIDCIEALMNSDIPKVGQNFVYDLQYLMKLGIRCRNLQEDTMLLHHSKFSEMQKGLGFLGSVYTDEIAWKLMRRRKVVEKKSEKADE